MARGRARQILFRIFYSTSFTIVFLLTVAFACAGPIDVLYQSYRRDRLIDVFILAGIYVLTGLIAMFLYASRLYTNRSILKDLPKSFMPIDKAELPAKKVWRLIEDCKNRSAVIAYLARPRSRRVELEVAHAQARINTLLKPEHATRYHMFEPEWGTISHPGWSSPAATETPNLNYSTVVAELVDLIEARAVSLAPVHPYADYGDQGTAAPAEYIIEALQRPEEKGLRHYISQLISLDVLQDNSLTSAFLTLYERARFAPDPLSEKEFKVLMRMFAEILRSVRTLDTSHLDIPDDYEQDNQSVHDLDIRPHKLTTRRSIVSASTASLASSIVGSVRHHQLHPRTQAATTTRRSDQSSDSLPYNNISIHNQRLPSFATAVPRISNDSVRSLSSVSEPLADAESASASPDQQPDWTSPTSRPPFFRAPSSKSDRNKTNTRKSRTPVAESPSQSQMRVTRRSRLRRRSIASNATHQSSVQSLRSARSNGSVIRLNREFDGTRDTQPFEYAGPSVPAFRWASRTGEDGRNLGGRSG